MRTGEGRWELEHDVLTVQICHRFTIYSLQLLFNEDACLTRNPVEHATLPKEEHKTRDIWTAEVLQKALEACDDDILRLAINLAFSCSLRMGELLGLTWDCIDISPTSIELGQASIFVEKESDILYGLLHT